MKNQKYWVISKWTQSISLALTAILLLHLSVNGQTLSKGQGKKLLDSLLVSADSMTYEISRISPMEYDFQLLRANVDTDCNRHDCRKVKKSVITPKGDTLNPIFTDVLQLSSGNVVLINDFRSFQVTPNMTVTKVYDQFNNFENGLAVFVENGKYGICNTAGSILLKPSYDYLGAADNLNRIPAKKDGMWEILERKGNKILPYLVNDSIQAIQKKQMLKSLKIQNPQSGLWALLNDNAIQVTPYKYQSVIPFQGGTTIGQINYSWGLIGYDGEELSEFIYDKIYKSYGSNYMVSIGDTSPKYGLISETGNELIPVKYLEISKEPLHSNRINELYWVVKESNNLWGLLNLQGQPITELIYEKVDLTDYDNPKGLANDKWVELLKK